MTAPMKVRDVPGVERLSQLAYPVPVWRARRERGRNRLIVDRHTALVCEGFPRSGNTFLLAVLGRLYPDARVASRLQDFVLLQADVTANDADDRALLKRFALFGPPGIVFFDRDGSHVPDAAVIGFQDADRFLTSLRKAVPDRAS